jgi:putative tricarboxylic transport membrane protein
VTDHSGIRARIGFYVVCLIGSLVIATWFVTPAGTENFAVGGFVGPATWPRAMLLGIACCAGVLLLRNAAAHFGNSKREPTPIEAGTEMKFDNRVAALGVAILAIYVGAIPVIGFALATLGFFLAWLPYGRVRRPHVVVSVAIIGTVTLLYIFVKITTMPLDRGIGMFNGVTVSLYKLLGIY